MFNSIHPINSINSIHTKFRNCIYFLYEKLIVISSISIIIFYVSLLNDWKVYILVPITLITSIILIFRFFYFLHDIGIITFLKKIILFFYNGIIKIGKITFNWIEEYKISRIIWSLAIINLVLIVYYIYVNIDIFQIFKEIVLLIHDMIVFISNPKMIMEALNRLFEKMQILSLLNYVKNNYIIPKITLINEGNPKVVLDILYASFILIIIGFIPKLLFLGFKFIKVKIIDIFNFISLEISNNMNHNNILNNAFSRINNNEENSDEEKEKDD